jgi:CubicO group peptidase (beta-lactamase class C family)
MSEQLSKLHLSQIKTGLSTSEGKQALLAQKLNPERFLRHLNASNAAEPTTRAAYSSYFPQADRIPLDFRPVPLAGRSLDIDSFAQKVHATLKDLAISGYTLQARQRGQTVYTLMWNWARRPQDQPELGWSNHVKMHVASVSKLITSMAVVKLLHQHGISADAPIAPYMPSHFIAHATLANLTFRQLLTHTSGFRQRKEDGSGGVNDGYNHWDFTDYYAKGVKPADIGHGSYHNGNYVGLRFVIAILSGAIDRNTRFKAPRFFNAGDHIWNVIAWEEAAINGYEDFVRQHIFIPAGIDAQLEPGTADSLAYPINLNAKGAAHNARDTAGTAGWWFSTDEVLKIMSTYWRTNAIVPMSVARRALRQGFGVDGAHGWQYLNGRQDCFYKGGYWDINGDHQHCVVAYAPKDIELAVFVNSPIPSNNIINIVLTHMASSLK